MLKFKNYKISDEALYSLDYSRHGESILLSTFTGDFVIVNHGKINRKSKAQEKTINRVKFIGETSKIFASGDVGGNVKLFDYRMKKEIFNFIEQEEEITEIEYEEAHKMLLTTSIDGTLGVFDIRKQGKYSLYVLSDYIEDELYCMKLVRNWQKVACGTSEGPIELFNWEWFGNNKDRIIGHPGSVNCLEKYDENILISGCEDGLIRFLSVTQKFIHSMISDHKNLKIKYSRFNDINLISLDKNKKFLSAISMTV